MRISGGCKRLTRHVVIAGAGIGGLTAALALARQGMRVTLLEQAALLEDIGAGLQLPPNASRILAQLGVLEVLRGAVTPQRLRILRGRDGAALATMALGAAAERRWGAPMLVAHRADLIRALLEVLALTPGVDLRAGVTLTGLSDTGPEIVIAAQHGGVGMRLSADVLIGADGLNSLLRDHLQPGSKKLYSGRVAWRSLVEAGDAPAFARTLETSLWLGPKAHLVHYPVRSGTLVNVVAITSDAERSGSGDIWAQAGDAAVLAARFAAWHASARALIAAAPVWRQWPLFDRAPLARWHVGRVALLGDAAHPMLPFLAQGAAQAIEDAAVLARFLAGARNAQDGLAAYGAARSARAAQVQAASRRQGWIYHLSGPAAFARDRALAWLGPEKLAARNDWLYGYDARLC